MAFSVCSWNVEFFGSRRSGETHAQVARRIDEVFDFLYLNFKPRATHALGLFGVVWLKHIMPPKPILPIFVEQAKEIPSAQ